MTEGGSQQSGCDSQLINLSKELGRKTYHLNSSIGLDSALSPAVYIHDGNSGAWNRLRLTGPARIPSGRLLLGPVSSVNSPTAKTVLSGKYAEAGPPEGSRRHLILLVLTKQTERPIPQAFARL